MEKRLQKFMSEEGVMSRRAAEEEIKKGNVTVNGIRAVLGQKIDDSKDVVEYLGKRRYRYESVFFAPIAAEIVSAKLFEFGFGYFCVNARHALDIIIVVDNELSVGGLVDVELDAVSFHIYCEAEGIEGVFGGVC